MSSNPARQVQRKRQKLAEARAAKLCRQALGSMYVMEQTFWATIQGFPLLVRCWIAAKIVCKRMQPVMHEKSGEKQEEPNPAELRTA